MGAITIHYRGGGHGTPSAGELDHAIERLVDQLTTEEWETPDDEHTQGFVTRANGDSLTGYVDGLMRLDPDFIDGHPQPPRYTAVQTKAEMRALFRQFVDGTLPLDAAHGWVPKGVTLDLPGREFRAYPAS